MGIENRELIEVISEKIVNNRLEEALELIYVNENKLNEVSAFWNLKGILCTKAQEYNTALSCFETAVSKEENNIDYLYNLAYTYEAINNSIKAYYIYEKLERLVDGSKEKEELTKRMSNICSENQIIVEKDTSNKCGAEFGENIYSARNNVVQAMGDDSQPLVSVCILAYNNLEKYTKRCVECVLKYTKNIKYQLVLVDNGSDDGTFEYFKTVDHPNKKIVRVTKNIGSAYGGYQCYLNSSGRYMMFLCNDIFVTENWLSNMLTCALSDEKIGMVVPASDYVSNYQSINLEYKDFNDMQKKAAEYNKSNKKMWQERLRLITLGMLFKRECLDIIGFMDYGFFHDFGDDDITFRIRRAGYKAILCNDTFVCHAGKITDKGKEFSENSIKFGREIFKEKYNGIDAWDDIEYEDSLISILNTNEIMADKTPKILGIDTGCGQAILDIKNRLRQNNVFNTIDSAFSTDAKFFTDLNTVCQDVHVDRIEAIGGYFKVNYFDYIVIGKYINEYNNSFKVIKNAIDLLSDTGQLLVKIKNVNDIVTLLRILGHKVDIKTLSAKWLDYNELAKYVNECGCKVENIQAKMYEKMDKVKEYAYELVEFKDEDSKNHAFINEYIISIVRSHELNK